MKKPSDVKIMIKSGFPGDTWDKMKNKKVISAYLDEEQIKTWGDKCCNAYCMPAVMIKPYGDATIKVRITMERVDDKRRNTKAGKSQEDELKGVVI